MEETEGPEAGANSTIDPVAMALALSGASREKADAFLDDQRHHLCEQFKYLGKQLRLGLWEKRLGLLLRLATAFAGLAIAGGLACLVWDASQSKGLLIEPFSVPPDLAQRGMTGQVVAAELLDRLAAMEAQTNSIRASKSYINSWSQQDIKLDIPETGVSLAELEDFLREKLGHDIHITGEIVHTESGISLTVRAGVMGAESVAGPQAEWNRLVQQLGETVYGLTQPYRFAFYLASHGRIAEAYPVLKAIAETGAREDRSWGAMLSGNLSGERDGIDAQLRLVERAVALDPDNYIAQNVIAYTEFDKGLSEGALRDGNRAQSLLNSNRGDTIRVEAIPHQRNIISALIGQDTGSFQEAANDIADAIRSGLQALPGLSGFLAVAEASAHDLAAARATVRDPTDAAPEHGVSALAIVWAKMQIDSQAQNWPGVLSQADAIAPLLAIYPGLRSYLPSTTVPLMAYAEARLGRDTAAEARIAATPAECDPCLIVRARIAERRGQRARAAYWFARAAQQAPSIPFAYADWGEALLARGDANGAIAKFKLANQKGPHFADPLEGWGEALMAKNQSHLALAKFAKANKYAPNWGRLHLKWGEAFYYVDSKDDARAQFALASSLDLTPSEKAELAKVHDG